MSLIVNRSTAVRVHQDDGSCESVLICFNVGFVLCFSFDSQFIKFLIELIVCKYVTSCDYRIFGPLSSCQLRPRIAPVPQCRRERIKHYYSKKR